MPPGLTGPAATRWCGSIFLPPGPAAASARCATFPATMDAAAYPDYYLQNFHHQTDGYLSDHSAALYDLQVELLFNGTADPMRRRVFGPLVQGLKAFADRPPGCLRVLDVATGTGRTLRQLRGALPKAQLIGSIPPPLTCGRPIAGWPSCLASCPS